MTTEDIELVDKRIQYALERATHPLTPDEILYVINAEAHAKMLQVSVDMVLKGDLKATYTGDNDDEPAQMDKFELVATKEGKLVH